MARNIKFRRLFELLLRVVSIVFFIEILFSCLCLFSMSREAETSFRNLAYSIQAASGLTVIVLSAVLVLFSAFLAFKDKCFPFVGFLISLVELLISVALVTFTGILDIVLFEGLKVLI